MIIGCQVDAWETTDHPVRTPFGRTLRVEASLPWNLKHLRGVLRDLAARFDVVVIDTPPVRPRRASAQSRRARAEGRPRRPPKHPTVAPISKESADPVNRSIFRILLGQMIPTEGSVEVVGRDVAEDPVAMARAFKLATEAGRLAYEAGAMAPRDFASPSTPIVGTPFWHAAVP